MELILFVFWKIKWIVFLLAKIFEERFLLIYTQTIWCVEKMTLTSVNISFIPQCRRKRNLSIMFSKNDEKLVFFHKRLIMWNISFSFWLLMKRLSQYRSWIHFSWKFYQNNREDRLKIVRLYKIYQHQIEMPFTM